MKIALACRIAVLGVASAMLCAPVAGAQQEEVRVGPSDTTLMPVRYAEIEIQGPLLETLPDLYLLKPGSETLYELLARIRQAGDDDTVQGVIIKLRSLQAGWAKAQELRRAVLACRREGKEVICYLEGGGNLEYYLASAADRVVLIPSGSLLLVGLRAEGMFFKGLLEKIGVKADLVQIGRYKGADESYTRTTSSEPFGQSINELLDDIHGQLVGAIASGRKMEHEAAADLISKGPFTAQRAKAAGLVDELKFYDELIDALQERQQGPLVVEKGYGEPDRRPAPGAGSPQDILKLILGMGGGPAAGSMPKGPVIAVVYAVGPIVLDDPDNFLIGESIVNAERLSRLIRELRERENVRAIVLRVNSPGGSADASDLIWHELRRANEVKPVIVSLSDVAGSGGYYIASAGRLIYANEGTMTGSIGVVGGKVVLTGLFEKLGVTVDVFQRGENAGLFSPVEEFTDKQRERYRELLQATYETFLDRIVTSRGLTLEELADYTEGRTLTGSQAREGKLVDAIGGLKEAIRAARLAAGFPPDAEVAIVRLPRSQSIIEAILWGRQDEVRAPGLPLARHMPADALPALRYLNALRCLEGGRAAALMPEMITIR